MRRLLAGFALTLLLVAPAGVQAQQSDSDARRAAMEARRDSLEAEVVQKFVRRLTKELSLTADQQTRTERVLRESGLRRRELSRESMQLRSRIYRAARSAETPEAEFVRLLAEHEALRTREHELWQQDQEQLARFMNPRQRAQFLLAWAHFQDDMRDILSRRMRQQGDSRDRQSGDRQSNDKPGDQSRRDRHTSQRDSVPA